MANNYGLNAMPSVAEGATFTGLLRGLANSRLARVAVISRAGSSAGSHAGAIARLRPALRLGLAFAVATFFGLPALAQDFPTKPLRIIVTVSPGGGPTIASTLLSEQMTPLLGQPIVVDHRPGAGGVSAILDLINAPADGHTLIVLDASHWAVTPSMRTDLPYDPLRDLAAIGSVYKSVQLVVVGSSFPASTLQEFIAYARARPGQLSYGSGGVGSIFQLIMEAFAADAGLKLNHVPYKGGADSFQALLRGDVAAVLNGTPVVLPQLANGKVKVLAVATGTRSKLIPDVPTIAEAAGIPDFNFVGELAMFARAGTPKPVMDKLSVAFRKAAAHPDLVARALKTGIIIEATTPEEMTETVRADLKKYGRAVKLAGLGPVEKR